MFIIVCKHANFFLSLAEFGFWCTKKDPKKDTKPMAGFSAKVVYARECTPDGKPLSPLSRDERS